MKKFIRYISTAALLMGIAACSEEIDAPETPAIEEGVTLTIMSSAPQTRTMAGVQDLNENKIVSLHYFLYPENPSAPTADNTEVDPKFWGKITGLNAQNLQMIRLNLTEYELNYEVFPRPYTSCDVYVIANLPESIDVETLADRKLSTLKQLALEADFASSLTQENFVMEGMAQAKIIDRKNIIAATGTIPVDRVASKVSVNVRVVESLTPTDGEIEVNGKTWTSEPENMTIELVNGVSNAVLGADPAGLELSYFRTAKEQRAFTENTENGTWVCDPFYSYPSAWNIGDDNEPYLRISMPWYTIIDTPIGGVEPPVTVYRNCYYKVILGGDQLKRNTWYDLTIDIGVLGSFDEQEEILLPMADVTYYVADWFDGLQVESEILGGRYLVVERETYEVFNQDELEIPFTTSHTCEIVDMSDSRNPNQATITYPDYSDEDANENAPYTWNSANWKLSIINDKILFEHKLNNDLNGTNYDYAPYTIKFTIRHTDATTTFYKDLTIIQHPAMTIEAKHNSGTYNDGFAYVNNGRGNNYGGNPDGLANNNNKNQNMYVITTSALPDFIETDFLYGAVIGDPRESTIDNLNSTTEWNNWNAAAATTTSIQGTNRSISYYYPTDQTDGAANMIAPKFRIASSHGACTAISYDAAFKRCASYQEDGYPAGRWRVPTKMELMFMSKLTDDQVIPRLLGNDSTGSTAYWCGDGYVNVPNASNTTGTVTHSTTTATGTRYVRCVYDEWYWENSTYARLDEADYDTFTWGDMPRENFQ